MEAISTREREKFTKRRPESRSWELNRKIHTEGSAKAIKRDGSNENNEIGCLRASG